MKDWTPFLVTPDWGIMVLGCLYFSRGWISLWLNLVWLSDTH
jgi:hypothetical protein